MGFSMISKNIRGPGRLAIEEDLKGQDRELGIFNGDTEEWLDAQKKYERLQEYLPSQISIRTGFAKLRGG